MGDATIQHGDGEVVIPAVQCLGHALVEGTERCQIAGDVDDRRGGWFVGHVCNPPYAHFIVPRCPLKYYEGVFHHSTPSQTWASTTRGRRMRAGRPACQAAKAMTQTAAYVNATRVSTADQPNTGGRRQPKKTKVPPNKPPRPVGLPQPSSLPGVSTPT